MLLTKHLRTAIKNASNVKPAVYGISGQATITFVSVKDILNTVS